MLTLYFLIVRWAPLPSQVGHGSSITVPPPPQREHGWEIEKSPCPCDSMPRPWQRGQTLGVVPGLAPDPPQVGQRCVVGTDSGTWAPSSAWRNEIDTAVSMSRPRSGLGP